MSPSETKFVIDGEDITEELHPSGKCNCAGEGTCDWCKKHCMECGAPQEIHPVTQEDINGILGSNSGAEPHDFMSRACFPEYIEAKMSGELD